MPVTITIPTALRQYAGGNSEIEVEAKTAGEALGRLAATHAELRKHLYTDQNALRNFVNVYVNDEDIRHLKARDAGQRRNDHDRALDCGARRLKTRPPVSPRFNENRSLQRHLIIAEVAWKGSVV